MAIRKPRNEKGKVLLKRTRRKLVCQLFLNEIIWEVNQTHISLLSNGSYYDLLPLEGKSYGTIAESCAFEELVISSMHGLSVSVHFRNDFENLENYVGLLCLTIIKGNMLLQIHYK